MTLKTSTLRLTLFALLLGLVTTLPVLAGPTVIGSAVASINASLGGQTLFLNSTIFSGDSLQVRDGIAVIAVGNNDRMIFGRDTVASFLRDSNEITVLLSQGNISMLQPNNGTPLRVKAGEISITAVAGYKTLGEVAMVDGSVVITAKEGALQVEDHGATTNVAKGQTIVIAPKTAKGGSGARSGGGASTALQGAGVGMSLAGGANTTPNSAVSAANAANAAAKFARPGSSRPTPHTGPSVAKPKPPGVIVPPPGPTPPPSGPCPPSPPSPLPPTPPVASTVFPFVGSSGPPCTVPGLTVH
jgi:hypothetical protein